MHIYQMLMILYLSGTLEGHINHSLNFFFSHVITYWEEHLYTNMLEGADYECVYQYLSKTAYFKIQRKWRAPQWVQRKITGNNSSDVDNLTVGNKIKATPPKYAIKEATLMHITQVLLVSFGTHLVGIVPLHVSTLLKIYEKNIYTY
jgi:hypothetical protein